MKPKTTTPPPKPKRPASPPFVPAAEPVIYHVAPTGDAPEPIRGAQS